MRSNFRANERERKLTYYPECSRKSRTLNASLGRRGIRGIASLEIRTKILRKILNYLLVIDYLTSKFVRFLQKKPLIFRIL